MPREPGGEGPRGEREMGAVKVTLIDYIITTSEHHEIPVAVLEGIWKEGKLRIHRIEMKDSNLQTTRIRSIAERLNIKDVVEKILKTYEGADNADLDCEIDFGSDSVKWPASSITERRINAYGNKMECETERFPQPNEPLHISEIKIEPKPGARIGILKLRASTEKRATAVLEQDPRDKEMQRLREQLTKAQGENDRLKKTVTESKRNLDTEQNARAAERKQIIAELEAALRDPGFLKGNLVKTVQGLVKRLKEE